MESNVGNQPGPPKFSLEVVTQLKTDVEDIKELTADFIELLEFWLTERSQTLKDVGQLHHPRTSNGSSTESMHLLTSGVAACSSLLVPPNPVTTPICLATGAIMSGSIAGVNKAKKESDRRTVKKVQNLMENDSAETFGLQEFVQDYLLLLRKVQGTLHRLVTLYRPEIDDTKQCLGYTQLLEMVDLFLKKSLADHFMLDGFQRCQRTCSLIAERLQAFSGILKEYVHLTAESEKNKPVLKTGTGYEKISGLYHTLKTAGLSVWQSYACGENPSPNSGLTNDLVYNNGTAAIANDATVANTNEFQNDTDFTVIHDSDFTNSEAEVDEVPKWIGQVITALKYGTEAAQDIHKILKMYW